MRMTQKIKLLAQRPMSVLGLTPSDGGSTLPYAWRELVRLRERKRILKHAKKGGVGAELGVFRGLFAAVMAKELQPERFYLVDPWRKLGTHFPWRPDSPMTCQGRLTTQQALDDTKAKIAKFPAIDARYIEDYSENFLRELDEQLDWIYIDSAHSYPGTLKELHLAAKVLKPDGVIIGDDWRTNPKVKHSGVMRAVNRFVKDTEFIVLEAGRGKQFCLRRYDNL